MCYTLTQSELKVIREFKSHNGVECYICHKTIIIKDEVLTVDHKVPVSRGGKTIPENLGICCHNCNSEKSDMTEQEYRNYLINKEYIVKNNVTLKTIQDMINLNASVNLKFQEVQSLYNSKIREKADIEKCIGEMNFNASEGYMLCRDMKKVLLEIKDNKKEVSRLQKLSLMAYQQNKELNKTYIEMVNDVMSDIRCKMNIGNLKDKKTA